MALKFTADGVKKTQPCVTLKSTPWKLHSKCLIFDDCEQTQTERRKNEVIVVACSNQQCRLRDISIYINEAIITPKSNVKKKNLDAVLDATLSMEKQVSSVARKMYFKIRRI